VGGGGAVLVAGIVLLAVGQNKIKTADDGCPNRVCPDPDTEGLQTMGNTGRTYTGVGSAMLAVGALAAGGGLLWYFLTAGGSSATDGKATSRAALQVQPWVSPWTSGLSLSGSF